MKESQKVYYGNHDGDDDDDDYHNYHKYDDNDNMTMMMFLMMVKLNLHRSTDFLFEFFELCSLYGCVHYIWYAINRDPHR